MQVHVTPHVATALVNAEAYLAKVNFGKPGQREKLRIDGTVASDAEHFVHAVRVLEGLAAAILEAMSTVSLTGPVKTGARFEMIPDGQLSNSLHSTVAFLRNDVSAKLEGQQLAQYSGDETGIVIDQLKRLHGALTGSIAARAARDLRLLKDTGVSFLLDAARALDEAVADSQRPKQAEGLVAKL